MGAVVAVAVLLGAGAAAGAWWWVRHQFETIPTFDQAPVLPSGEQAPPLVLAEPVGSDEARTYLVFSTGSAGLGADDAERLGIDAGRATMADGLTDTLMLVVANPKTAQVSALSIPRDLWIDSVGDRINSLYVTKGPQALADAVTGVTGLPVNHMVAVNFTGFAELVDAVGGVTVWVPAGRDRHTGFLAEREGCAHLDGPTALAYVRSRHWEAYERGKWREDPTGDFGRIRRQHQVLRAVADDLLNPSALVKLPDLFGVARRALVIDAGITFDDSAALVRRLGRTVTEPQMYSYPAVPAAKGAKSVVVADRDAARPILDELRAVLDGTSRPAAPSGVIDASGDPGPAAGGASVFTGSSTTVPPATTPPSTTPPSPSCT